MGKFLVGVAVILFSTISHEPILFQTLPLFKPRICLCILSLKPLLSSLGALRMAEVADTGKTQPMQNSNCTFVVPYGHVNVGRALTSWGQC